MPSSHRTFLLLPLVHQVSSGDHDSGFTPTPLNINFRSDVLDLGFKKKKILIFTFYYFVTVPPPEERNRLWMVEAEISPEMIKRKKKKKKRKKEVRPVEEMVDHQVYRQREFGRSSVPRLPKLPPHPSLVANLQEQQRQQQKIEEEVLPGSYPDFQPSRRLSCEEKCPYLQYQTSQNGYGHSMLSDPLTFRDRPEDLGLGPRYPPSNWQPSASSRYPGNMNITDGISERMAHVARVPAGRRAGYGPIHSRTNLMEAELMDADSDF